MSDLFLGAPQQEHHEAPPPSRRSRRDSQEQRAKQKKHRRRRSVVVLLLALVLVGGAAFVVWSVFGGLFSGGGSADDTVQDYPGPGSGEVQVTVASGDTGGAIGQTLVDNGVVATVQAFTSAYAANPAATGIQPGTYGLQLEMKASDAVNALLDPANRVSNRVTIPEGYTASQIYQRVYEVTGITVEDLQAAAADPAAIGLPAEAGGNVEGWLFPMTYEVEPGSTAASVLSQMVARTTALLTEKGVAQDQWETVLNQASIVEREGKLDEDRAKIARAIDNRLAQGMPLQIDAINAYGLGIPGTQLTYADTSQAQPPYNPYNSYKITGLPPTPIANPGEVSIDAVLNPADGPWLFWVTVNLDTGETKFAETYDEHQTYVDELREWQAANE
ncbi:endolytic transglycosylase MltG [Cellulomonas sp.]|uniref:endolytic transglycosylase MltG n=1 Tax=Cellulomonas sp. TaxID=40001 RepID=UPI002D23DB83|nr:endolytic transglycosylase MltG [Cellulomonas sp.]HYQ74913.1 endolytic transglycosylase MltG [Cellulomonas sp.]